MRVIGLTSLREASRELRKRGHLYNVQTYIQDAIDSIDAGYQPSSTDRKRREVLRKEIAGAIERLQSNIEMLQQGGEMLDRLFDTVDLAAQPEALLEDMQ